MFNLSLSKKIPLVISGLAASAAIAAGIIGFIQGGNAVRTTTEEKLSAIVNSRAASLEQWYHAIEGDLTVQSENPLVHEALYDFKTAWDEMGTTAETSLQDLYITSNPHPTGSKDELDFASDGSTYSMVHRQYHPYFRSFLRDRGYYDIFLFDVDGNLIYTVFKELDYATNLNNGKYAGTDLGNAFRAARDSAKRGSQTYFDFKPYAPSHGAPAAFISTPLLNEAGEFNGVLVFQMPIDTLNTLMNQSDGLGQTGETYAVGEDRLMRSDSRFSEDSTILVRTIETETAEAALNGNNGIAHTVDYRGDEVLSAYTSVNLGGSIWAVIADQDETEVMALVDGLLVTLIQVIGLGVLILAGIGIWVGRTTTKPILAMAKTMGDIAEGNTEQKIPGRDRADELGKMAAAVDVFRLGLLEASRLREEQENERIAAREGIKKAIQSMAEQVEDSTASLIEDVSKAMSTASDASHAMDTSARRVKEDSQRVAAAAEESQASLGTVSQAAEGLANSIREISSEMGESLSATNEAVSAGDDAKMKITSLSDSVVKISDVVEVITGIAEQTNLLALNATIEAARAGESGKGFAVVASEVKDLANQTAKSTEEIGVQISEIQQSTQEAVQSFSNITDALARVQSVAETIADSVEKQNTATEEIAATAEETKRASDEVAQSVTSVSGEAGKTSDMTQELNQVIDSVTAMVSKLGSNLVKVVRTSTAEADRRLTDRIAGTSPCDLVVDGVTYKTSISDLTSTGARVKRPSGIQTTMGNLVFMCPSHNIQCEASIVESGDMFIRLRFLETQNVKQVA